jgi:hypothetical protein
MGATLVQLIDRINDAIGAGASTSTLRSQLSLLREQAEATDAHIQELEARIEQHEAQSQLKNVGENQERLEDGAEKILKLLFDSSDDEFEHVGVMAGALGMQKGVVQYHCDVLYEAGFLGISGPQMFHLYPKGRAYVVKYLMNE